MVIVGGGVIAMEMAQAFACFGSAVTVLVRSTLMAREEPEASAAVQQALEADGVRFVFGVGLTKVVTLRMPADTEGSLPLLRLTLSGDESGADMECEGLLLATGRTPNVEELGLEAAGIAFTPRDGIQIDDLGRTTNERVYALGDCAAGVPRFTHVSGEMAKLVVQNALFGDEWKVSSLVVPRCAYTEPEVASVGLTKAVAQATRVAIDTYRTSLEHNDRVILEGQGAHRGFVEIHCKQGTDVILGATVVAASAGDIINEVTLAIQSGVGLAGVARVIHPYPTLAEGVMQAGLGFIRKHWKTKGSG